MPPIGQSNKLHVHSRFHWNRKLVFVLVNRSLDRFAVSPVSSLSVESSGRTTDNDKTTASTKSHQNNSPDQISLHHRAVRRIDLNFIITGSRIHTRRKPPNRRLFSNLINSIRFTKNRPELPIRFSEETATVYRLVDRASYQSLYPSSYRSKLSPQILSLPLNWTFNPLLHFSPLTLTQSPIPLLLPPQLNPPRSRSGQSHLLSEVMALGFNYLFPVGPKRNKFISPGSFPFRLNLLTTIRSVELHYPVRHLVRVHTINYAL